MTPAKPVKLTIKQILAWADKHQARTGDWPTKKSGPVIGVPGMQWGTIEYALLKNRYGIHWGATLLSLLAKHRGLRNNADLPRLKVKQILAWADAHYKRTGNWPTISSGKVAGHPNEKWSALHSALYEGSRGLRGGSSLPILLAKYNRKRHKHRCPRLTEHKILTWADSHRKRTGDWPSKVSGQVMDDHHESWAAINDDLKQGYRGLPGDSSLAQLLAKNRERRHVRFQPRLTEKQILDWADAHYKCEGRWPMNTTGPVHDVPDEKWSAIDSALEYGRRGLRGNTTLARFLAKHRDRPFQQKGQRITERRVVKWIKAHRTFTGKWPTRTNGSVLGTKDAKEERWTAIDNALRVGLRGLPGSNTLLSLLAKEFGVRSLHHQPRLTIKKVLAWADSHKKRTGDWPTSQSGKVHGVPDESWMLINTAFIYGRRGLPNNTSLAEILAKHRGRRHKHQAPHLSVEKILDWTDAYYNRTGKWPGIHSGPVDEDPEETWAGINGALIRGQRGLTKSIPLSHLLVKHRGKYDPRHMPHLTSNQILAWADAHYQQTGNWPTSNTVRQPEDHDETWSRINNALNYGIRGLPGGMSLPQLLVKYRGKRDALNPPRLSKKQILAWADAYYKRRGDWPARESGRLEEDPYETWSAINKAIVKGTRGLRGRSSLVNFLLKHRKASYQRKGIPLKRNEILDWAASHHELTGKLPTTKSGDVRDNPGETWAAIDASLRAGSRALQGASSLSELLSQNYTPAYQGMGQILTAKKILKWADEFHKQLGRWPNMKDAFVDSTRGEKWSTVDLALRDGFRGLEAGSSLRTLLLDNRIKS